MTPRRRLTTVLFDLDGTLLDTAPDLAFALNHLREERGMAALSLATIRPQVSHGTAGLLALGLGVAPEHAQFAALRQRLLAIYSAHLARETRLFEGMESTISALEARGLRWGVVTNKPGHLTRPLLAQLGLQRRAATIVSGDTTPYPKPHPAPLLHACYETGSSPRECLYVGDAARDVEAGRRAGMRTLVALFGYLGKNDRPADWGADALVHTPQEILAWLAHHG